MYEYLTRAMVARKPMNYLGQSLQAGDEFVATPVDGDYLIKCGRAEDAPGRVGRTVVVEQRVVTDVAVHLPNAPEQVNATSPESAPPQEAEAPIEAAQEAAADEMPAASDQAPVRRRGRPTNAERAARESAAVESSGDASV